MLVYADYIVLSIENYIPVFMGIIKQQFLDCENTAIIIFFF
jgi:hypothetical protein